MYMRIANGLQLTAQNYNVTRMGCLVQGVARALSAEERLMVLATAIAVDYDYFMRFHNATIMRLSRLFEVSGLLVPRVTKEGHGTP